jgi:hypothetical protein
MPVIRKLWPKYAIKEVFKTEVAKTPRFVVSYMRPYMYRGNEAKVYLPKGLIAGQAGGVGTIKDSYVEATLSLVAGAAVTVDLGKALVGTDSTQPAGSALTAISGFGLVSGAALSGSNTKRQSLDSELRVTAVTILDAAGGNVEPTLTLKVPTHKIDVTGSIFLSLTHTAAGVALASPIQVIVRADLQAGTALVAVLGSVPAGYGNVTVALKAGVSTEFNETGFSIGFDIARLDIDIPTGQHINAPLPIEALNDMMALYQIDGTKETVDLMTNVFATRLDLEALAFLNNSFDNQPGVAEFADYPGASTYTLAFDVRPAAGFAGSPKAWREELKPQIDFLAQRIKNQTYLQAGIFTIVGNPLDIQLLTNVDWQFRGGQGSNMDGVDVDYSVGTYVGANAYRVIASVNAPQGEIFLVFTPNSETQMTYKYYPYTFSTEMGYIDPNRSRVPSIMMTKRHTFAEFLPAIGLISIINNTGNGQFTSGYWPSTTTQFFEPSGE